MNNDDDLEVMADGEELQAYHAVVDMIAGLSVVDFCVTNKVPGFASCYSGNTVDKIIDEICDPGLPEDHVKQVVYLFYKLDLIPDDVAKYVDMSVRLGRQ